MLTFNMKQLKDVSLLNRVLFLWIWKEWEEKDAGMTNFSMERCFYEFAFLSSSHVSQTSLFAEIQWHVKEAE